MLKNIKSWPIGYLLMPIAALLVSGYIFYVQHSIIQQNKELAESNRVMLRLVSFQNTLHEKDTQFHQLASAIYRLSEKTDIARLHCAGGLQSQDDSTNRIVAQFNLEWQFSLLEPLLSEDIRQKTNAFLTYAQGLPNICAPSAPNAQEWGKQQDAIFDAFEQDISEYKALMKRRAS